MEVDGLEFDEAKLPANLRHLAPYIVSWSVSDDVARQEMVEASSEEELAQLAANVGPLLGAIDAYLDSFSDEPEPDEAMLLGSLAELVSELKFRDS